MKNPNSKKGMVVTWKWTICLHKLENLPTIWKFCFWFRLDVTIAICWKKIDLLSSSCFPPQVYSLNWSYKKKGLKTTQEQEIWKGSCTGLMLPTVRSLGLGWTSVQQSWVYVTQGWLSCPSRPIFLILEGPIPSLSLVDNRKWGDL